MFAPYPIMQGCYDYEASKYTGVVSATLMSWPLLPLEVWLYEMVNSSWSSFEPSNIQSIIDLHGSNIQEVGYALEDTKVLCIYK